MALRYLAAVDLITFIVGAQQIHLIIIKKRNKSKVSLQQLTQICCRFIRTIEIIFGRNFPIKMHDSRYFKYND